MNRKWIYRAVTAAVAAGGMLLFGAAAANAALPVASTDQPAVQTSAPGLAHPIMAQRDPATQQGTVLPGAVFNESASTQEDLPGVSTAAGQTPTNGTRVDVPKLTGAAAPVIQPVQKLAGPAAGPLSGLTGGGATEDGLADPAGLPLVGPLLGGAGQAAPADQPAPADQQAPAAPPAGPTDETTGPEASVVPLPLSMPAKTVPVLSLTRTEDGFTVGQNSQLPTDGLFNKAGTTVAGTVTKLSGAPSLGMPGESATEGSPIDGLTGGANVAGLPVSQVTEPVTSQLNGGGLTGQEAAPTDQPVAPAEQPAAPADQQPAADQPSDDQQQPATPGTGSDPLSAVTGLLGQGLV